MKIWEAILYGIFGGIAELLPISFSGHVALLRNAFHMSSLTDGGGYFIRAAVCLGVFAAIFLSFRSESQKLGREVLRITGLKKRRRRERVDRVYRRSVLLGFFALVPMLCSLFFLASAERIERLLYIILFFLLNAAVLYLCCRGAVGKKTEKNATPAEVVLVGVCRMLSVFPGLSSLGTSVAVGRAVGFDLSYNLRLAYLLTLVYQIPLFLFYLIRGFAFGAFSSGLLLPMLFAAVFSAVFGYLAIQYFRYLLQRKKLNAFVYYSLEISAVAAILALINA